MYYSIRNNILYIHVFQAICLTSMVRLLCTVLNARLSLVAEYGVIVESKVTFESRGDVGTRSCHLCCWYKWKLQKQ